MNIAARTDQVKFNCSHCGEEYGYFYLSGLLFFGLNEDGTG